MRPTIRTALLLILLSLPGLQSVYAQVRWLGKISDASTGQPVENMMVRVVNAGKVKSFVMSDSKGAFVLESKQTDDKDELVFSHLAYQSKTIHPQSPSTFIKVSVTPKSIALREVTVSQPRIAQKKDTLVYNIASFIGKGDKSLEDGLKKIPGIQVNDNGSVQYQGKDISKFYIEGSDIISQNYTVATKSMPVKAVSKVEVMENHQPIKQLQGKVFSNQVALNIKLKNKYLFKPFGSSEVGVGINQDKDPLYRAVGSVMGFNPRYQFIGSIKLSNNGAEDSRNTFFMSFPQPRASTAAEILGEISGSSPPLKRKDYTAITDHMVSLNARYKHSNDAYTDAKVDYIYNKGVHTYDVHSHYYTPARHIDVYEISKPMSALYQPTLTLRYHRNDSLIYLLDEFKVKGKFEKGQFDLWHNSDAISQTRSTKILDVTNSLNLLKTINDKRVSLNWDIQYNYTPRVNIAYGGDLPAADRMTQQAQNSFLSTRFSAGMDLNIGRHHMIRLPLTVSYLYNRVETMTDPLLPYAMHNELYGYSLSPMLNPSYTYTGVGRKFVLTLSTPLGLYRHSFRDVPGAKDRFVNRFVFNPTLSINYDIISNLKLSFESRYNENIGDITDYLTAPIRVNYRTDRIASGITSLNKFFYTRADIDYKRPLDLFFINMYCSYGRLSSNLISNISFLLSQKQLLSILPFSSHTDNIKARVGVSKQLIDIKTKIGGGIQYIYSKSYAYKESERVPVSGHSPSVDFSFNTNPYKWIDVGYDFSYALQRYSYAGIKSSLNNNSHAAKMRVYPLSDLALIADASYNHHKIAERVYKDFFMMNAALEYKIDKVKLKLEVNNILNRRTYSYTLFSNADFYSYNYHLRPREIFISLSLF
ncbi:hypothetical protein [Porphyromonas pogonae]|uniref:hypothetical protein n=1 Tax=Porphyromonas pogonae TaxID=867595 RepID=UPI002E76A74B|nr:hypothetical protein [Porphyromonas pogonae]